MLKKVNRTIIVNFVGTRNQDKTRKYYVIYF